MKIIFRGHSCFEIHTKGQVLLIDPFLRDNPQANLQPEQLEEVDAVLVSHGHDDHLGDAIEISKNNDALIITNFEIGGYAESLGAKVHQLHIGGKNEFPFGTVKLTPALHGSGIPKGDGTFLYGGLACGFLLQLEGKWIYHAGDTGLFGDMELIGRYYDLEAALLPIGDNFVMGPEDAGIAANMLRAKYIIPMHFNTFPIIAQDGNAFIEMLHRKVPESKGILLQPDETLEI